MRENNGRNHDIVHPLWSEGELDDELAALHDDVEVGEDALDDARARLLRVTRGTEPVRRCGPPVGSRKRSGIRKRPKVGKRRSWPRWFAAAAATVVVVTGVTASQTMSFDGDVPVSSAAAETLNRAANRIESPRSSDQRVGPGQYRYIATHAWWMSTAVTEGTNYSWLAENVLETWVPADATQEWLLRRDVTGERKWVVGTEEEARAAGVPLEGGWPEGEWTAPCGEFFAAGGRQPCEKQGSWSTPTREWLAELPRDPERLLQRMRRDVRTSEQPTNVALFGSASAALRTGRVPTDLRAALYRVLAMTPEIELVDRRANLDGRIGVALGVRDGGERREIIIDPDSGEFIGERTVAVDVPAYPPGAVLEYTAVERAVVERMGAAPIR